VSRRNPEQEESNPESRIPSPGTSAPIGVFDSGVGGLSVLREIRRELPAEDLIYVADSGYAPYGDRPEDYVRGRALAIMEFLRAQDVKAVVVACNTATGIAVDALRAALGAQAPVAWLVGADSFLGLTSWKRWRELLELSHFIVAQRPGSLLEGGLPTDLNAAVAGRWVEDAAALRTSAAGRILRLDQPLQAHSATDLRQRIAAGASWRGLVPPAVADYIAEHRLYGYAGDPAVIGMPPSPSL